MALSLSHRAGRGLAAVAGAGCAVGCDLELVEPRSDAFVALWLAPGEQAVAEAGWAMVIASDPAPAAPRDLGRP